MIGVEATDCQIGGGFLIGKGEDGFGPEKRTDFGLSNIVAMQKCSDSSKSLVEEGRVVVNKIQDEVQTNLVQSKEISLASRDGTCGGGGSA